MLIRKLGVKKVDTGWWMQKAFFLFQKDFLIWQTFNVRFLCQHSADWGWMVENMLRGNRLFHTLGFQIAKRKKAFSTTLLCDKTFHNVNSNCPWKIIIETFTQMAITSGKKWGKKEKIFILYTYDECCATHPEQKLSFSLICSWNALFGFKWVSIYKNTWRRICAKFSYV